MQTRITSDFDCIIYLNNQQIGKCSDGNTFSLNLEKGKNLISFESKDDLSFPREDRVIEVGINNHFETLLISLTRDTNKIQVNLKYKDKERYSINRPVLTNNNVYSKHYYTGKISIFSFKGRIGRLRYFLTALISYILVLMAYYMIGDVDFEIEENAQLIYFLLYTVYLWINIANNTKRCHDLGGNGWWQLVPLFVFWLLFDKGNEGDNEYGPESN